MMTWNGFVRGEDFHFPRRTSVELVGVDEELAGAMRLGRASLVVSRRLRWRRIGWNRRDSVGEARQSPEESWQLRIDALRDVTITPHERGGIRIEKLRIGAEHGGERDEITGEPGRP